MFKAGSAFAAVAVDGGGLVLASGHEDSTCMLWDLRKSQSLSHFRPHASEVRSVRFSPGGHILLTGSYDQTVKMTDVRGKAFIAVIFLTCFKSSLI